MYTAAKLDSNQCFMLLRLFLIQVEAKFKNADKAVLPDLIVEATPAHQLQQLWNLTAIEEGKLYSLPSFCTDYGGLQPDQEFGWGGISAAEKLRFIVRPANS